MAGRTATFTKSARAMSDGASPIRTGPMVLSRPAKCGSSMFSKIPAPRRDPCTKAAQKMLRDRSYDRAELRWLSARGTKPVAPNKFDHRAAPQLRQDVLQAARSVFSVAFKGLCSDLVFLVARDFAAVFGDILYCAREAPMVASFSSIDAIGYLGALTYIIHVSMDESSSRMSTFCYCLFISRPACAGLSSVSGISTCETDLAA